MLEERRPDFGLPHSVRQPEEPSAGHLKIFFGFHRFIRTFSIPVYIILLIINIIRNRSSFWNNKICYPFRWIISILYSRSFNYKYIVERIYFVLYRLIYYEGSRIFISKCSR